MVVSEMKLRLSPKNAPPATMPQIMAALKPDCSARPTATGMSAAMAEKLVQRMIEENIRQSRRIVPRTSVKSTRSFINTLVKTVDVLKKKGAVATTREIEYDDRIEYIVEIAK